MATNSNLQILCIICDETFDSQENFQTHLFKHSNQSFTFIPLCLHYNDNKSFYDHNAKTNIKIAKSQYKNNHYNAKRQQNEEINFSSFNGRNCRSSSCKFKEIYACSSCGKEFKRKDHLRKHLVVHSAIKPFTCLICGKSFSRKDRLKEHCVIHLSNGWSCYFCGKMFSQRCILRKHEMIHRGVKPFVCEICDTHFSRKNDLLRHGTSHTGKKSYFCEICGKGFTQNRLLKRHLLVHNKNKLKKNIKSCTKKNVKWPIVGTDVSVDTTGDCFNFGIANRA